MMNLEFLQAYFIPVIAGICLCVGFAMKKLDRVPNRYIPLAMLFLGAAVALWMHWGSVTAEVLLGGMFSGLASTGLYELFRSMMGGGADE